MTQSVTSNRRNTTIYPSNDGQSISESTKQFHWIVVIKENLERLFAQDSQVFIAGDLLWYPVKGKPNIRQTPDVMAAFGRPKGDRNSYQQWLEEDVAPQVVFEILSPGNRFDGALRKLNFYERYGVEEYYIINPEIPELTGLVRSNQTLTLLDVMDGWTSPRLDIQFQLTHDSLEIYRPDGERFLTYVELGDQLAAEQAQRQQDLQRIHTLEDKLRELGVDPESV